MNELDDKIRKALGEESAEDLMDPDREASLQALIAESFKGRSRWLAIINVTVRVLLTIASVVAAIRFFEVDGTRELIAWASVFIVTVVVSAIVGLAYWILLNRNSTTREIKRLELQIIRLARRVQG